MPPYVCGRARNAQPALPPLCVRPSQSPPRHPARRVRWCQVASGSRSHLLRAERLVPVRVAIFTSGMPAS